MLYLRMTNPIDPSSLLHRVYLRSKHTDFLMAYGGKPTAVDVRGAVDGSIMFTSRRLLPEITNHVMAKLCQERLSRTNSISPNIEFVGWHGEGGVGGKISAAN